jgi:hypothetical protein
MGRAMSVLDHYYRNAQRRLDLLQEEVREEPWKVAYREAEGCHFFELALGHVLEVIRYIREIDKSWRTAVYRGEENPIEGNDELIKGAFTRWLDLASSMERKIRYFEQRGYDIELAAEIRGSIEATERTLGNWVPPVPARSPAMRVEDVSEEEADGLRAVLEAPPGSPGKLNTAPLVLPEGDPSTTSRGKMRTACSTSEWGST